MYVANVRYKLSFSPLIDLDDTSGAVVHMVVFSADEVVGAKKSS